MRLFLRVVICITISLLIFETITPPQSSFARQDQAGLRVWWPDMLLSLDGENTTLEDEIDRFRGTYSAVNLEFRYRRFQPGEQVRELALVQEIAPTVLPDLTLMQEDELAIAVDFGLLQPLEEWIPNDILAEMPSNLLALGQNEDIQYGLPYLITLNHMVYNSAHFESPPATFADILTAKPQLLFPAGVNEQAVNDFLLSQYLAAGGYLTDTNNNPALDETIVTAIYAFYEEALIEGIYDNGLLNYTVVGGYLERISSLENAVAFVDSSTYLRERNRRLSATEVSFIITQTPTRFSLLDGWVWVLLTEDPARQALAQNFVNEMMRLDTLSRLADGLYFLPSRANAMRLMEDDPYFVAMRTLLISARYVSIIERNSAAARALQEGFEAVLQGTSAGDAAAAAVASLR